MVTNILSIHVFVVLGAGLINTCIWYSLTIIAHSFNNLVKKHFIRKEKNNWEQGKNVVSNCYLWLVQFYSMNILQINKHVYLTACFRFDVFVCGMVWSHTTVKHGGALTTNTSYYIKIASFCKVYATLCVIFFFVKAGIINRFVESAHDSGNKLMIYGKNKNLL